jgi:glycosyltransferase involved in cell wall biosynthesis
VVVLGGSHPVDVLLESRDDLFVRRHSRWPARFSNRTTSPAPPGPGGRSRLPRGLPSPRIVFAGRLHREKGPDLLLEAVARLADPPPTFVLGAGVMEPELRRRDASLGLERTVRFEGWRERTERWLAGASVCVVPSRFEALAQTAVLAMSLGVPVVGTAVEGLPGVLADGRGVLAAPEDPAALARAIDAY